MANSGGFAMAAPIRIRDDYSASELRRLARESSDANQCRRLLALAAILEGCSRSEAARIGGVGLQIIRDWVICRATIKVRLQRQSG